METKNKENNLEKKVYAICNHPIEEDEPARLDPRHSSSDNLISVHVSCYTNTYNDKQKTTKKGELICPLCSYPIKKDDVKYSAAIGIVHKKCYDESYRPFGLSIEEEKKFLTEGHL